MAAGHGRSAPACRFNHRVGGKYLDCKRSPGGQNYRGTGVYRDIVPMERIACTDSFADSEWNMVAASYYGMRGYRPLEMVVTVTFEEDGGKTVMTLRHDGIPRNAKSDCEAGWSGSFDKPAESLKR